MTVYSKPKRPKYYKRDGTAYRGRKPYLQWAKDRKSWDNKIVKQTKLENGIFVSTVWLGLDHSFLPKGKLLIFETMVFYRSMLELDMERYSTEEEAKAGHKEMVKRWSGIKAFLKALKIGLERVWWDIKWKLHDKNQVKRHA